MHQKLRLVKRPFRSRSKQCDCFILIPTNVRIKPISTNRAPPLILVGIEAKPSSFKRPLNYCLPLLIFRSSYGFHLALHASAKPINEQYVSFRVFLGQLSQKTKISNDPISLSAPCFLHYNYLSNRDLLRISQQLPHHNIYRLFE